MAKPVMERNTLETILVVEDQAPVLPGRSRDSGTRRLLHACRPVSGAQAIQAKSTTEGTRKMEFRACGGFPLQVAQSSQREWGLALQ